KNPFPHLHPTTRKNRLRVGDPGQSGASTTHNSSLFLKHARMIYSLPSAEISWTASVMKRKQLVHVLLAAAVILGATLARADDRNLLPKYGSLPKTEWQKAADAKFIAAIDEQYHGDRNKASADFAARGWEYVAERRLAEAMRRFNQAWLLNNNNGTALWGMAAIQASWEKFD